MTTQSEPNPDDVLRRTAAQRLSEFLDQGSALVARCEKLADAAEGDVLGPLNAAARLIRSNARIAEALAQLAQVERRRRSVVERIQTPELNSKIKDEISPAEARRRLEPRILQIVERIRAENMEQFGNPQHEAYLRARQEFEDELNAKP